MATQVRMYHENKPVTPPEVETREFRELLKFQKEVQLILQVVNENEYQAATTYMKPPTDNFDRAVLFPRANMVVGRIGGIKTVLLQADMGNYVRAYVEEAIELFPKALYIVSTGVCYAFSPYWVNFADVLVSDRISDLGNNRFDSNDDIVDQGQTVNVDHELNALFCMNLEQDPQFNVTQDRHSNVYAGNMVSYPALVDNSIIRDKIYAAIPGVYGGEMEGGELLKLQQDGKIKGVIVIKGVSDYADGSKTQDWQFTAASAALHYIESKLSDVTRLY